MTTSREYLNDRPASAPPPEFREELRCERRYELELTQQEVAKRGGTSHSFISKVERGDHIPTIPVLARILSVLDEQLLIGIERDARDEEPVREIAPALTSPPPELRRPPIRGSGRR
jgi:transcriptional regulator with XRE-family HTH domain